MSRLISRTRFGGFFDGEQTPVSHLPYIRQFYRVYEISDTFRIEFLTLCGTNHETV